MPTLGSPASSATGQVKPGVYLPNGWNTNWQAARNASGSTLAEAVIFGDSTTYGSCTSTGVNIYSWITKLRNLSVAAGYPDGGPGVLYDDVQDSANYDGFTTGYTVSKTGFADNTLSTLQVSPGTYRSVTLNDTITLKGKGTKCRLSYTIAPEMGSFTYAIDGGATTTVNAYNASTRTAGVVNITGLSDAVHQVTIANAGGNGGGVSVVAEFVRSTGIVYHKNAGVGNDSSTWFSGQIPTAGALNGQVALGLTPGVTGSSNSYDWGMAALGGNYRKPALAISAVGINDLQGLSIATEGQPTTAEQTTADQKVSALRNNLLHFVRLARAAGADPMIVVPHYDLALHTHTWGGQFINAVWNAGISAGCAVLDFNQAIRPVSTFTARGLGTPGVHATTQVYDLEATFLWQNALSL